MYWPAAQTSPELIFRVIAMSVLLSAIRPCAVIRQTKVTVVSEEITDKPSPSWFYISKTWMHPANSWSSPFLFQLRQNREDVRVSKKNAFLGRVGALFWPPFCADLFLAAFKFSKY